MNWQDRANIRMSQAGKEQRPGYAEVRAASRLHPESGAWAFFMREVVRLPRAMTPAVSQVICLGRWRDAPDPVESIRLDALEVHERAWRKPRISRSSHFAALKK